jgi:hypothetical protein
MNREAQQFMTEGNQYLKTAEGGSRRSGVFTPEILYNLLAMAIEKHIMGALIGKGSMADNHTFRDLVDSVDRVCPMDPKLAAELLDLEQYQEICPVFEGYNRQAFPRARLAGMTQTARAVKEWAEGVLAA